ncbi:DEAD/DEAH box helicase [Flexivirga lutea]
MTQSRPDTESILASLKDFQRSTVDYAFDRLWTAEDQVKKFLVADEVGLGKTMVAKGVIGKTIEHLWDTDKRIDIVYICSNSQIARQNLSRLNVVEGSEIKHADRLTLLPPVIRNLRANKVNFVSFTPGTSFSVGQAPGRAYERVVLYWMLVGCWGNAVKAARWKRFFEGRSGRERFEEQLGWFDSSVLDEELCQSFGEAIEAETGPQGGPLHEELEASALKFNYLRGKPTPEVGAERDRLIGALRGLVARASVEHLEPDLVILDEFQRFKDLLDSDDEGAQLANAIFEHPDAKVLLLSATPYKMYTLPDEPEGDDHYRDFTRTVQFLAGEERAHIVERELRTMRETLLAGGDHTVAREARDRVEHELRRVMCRTERLASTPSRDGMLVEKPMPGAKLATEDLRSWRTFDGVARHVDHHDVFEYWRSAPYPLNLMERGSYQIRKNFEAAAERNDPELRGLLKDGRGLLKWEEVRRYEQVDPGNAKLRGLSEDVLDRGVWRLAWLPPSLPYYETAGAYADPEVRSFTKRLIFSAWTVVPKAIAVMLSYEAERRAMEAAGLTSRRYDDRPITPPLQFRVSSGRLGGMPALASVYPSVTLARLGDPLEIARSDRMPIPISRSALLDVVRGRVRAALSALPDPMGSAAADQRWYWAAPFLFDDLAEVTGNSEVVAAMGSWAARETDDSESGGLARHTEQALTIRAEDLGPRPADLVDVLTSMAIGGPGVCALRALGRVVDEALTLDDVQTRAAAYEVAQGLRSLFNKPEIVAVLRSGEDDSTYWRAVLEHCVDGCLQSVLDEYAHVLVESEGLQSTSTHERVSTISEVVVEALSTRSATNVVEQVSADGGQIRLDEHRMSSHFAARFGRTQTDDQAAFRETAIRVAFNSPFRPFVLASTSVGQEGLDFHTYSHAIVHWNLPGNPVDLEQREGRVHRYKGHAVRKNVAAEFASAAVESGCRDPWAAMFEAAQAAKRDGESDIKPFWVFTGDAAIERYVPAMPLSRELQQYRRLQRTVGAYRMVIGQPRQDDLIRYVGEDASWLRIDLTP